MSRFLAFATLTTLVATPCIGSQQLDELLSRAERATTTKERVELWDGVDPKMGELTTVVEQALGSSNERVRIFGAMLLSKVGDEAAYGKQSSRAVNDKSLEVRRIAWLTKLVRRKSLSPDEIRTLQREHDLVLHTTAVVALDDNRQLSDLAVTAESRFLRAAAVRRLAMAWPKGGDEAIAAEAALDRALTSNDPLLRTSALLSARRVGYLPVSTLRGITFDSRPMLPIDCLLDISPEAKRLREQYGLAGEYVWSLSLLKTAMLHKLMTLLPPPEYPSTPLPLDDRVRIGAISAEAVVRARGAEGRTFVRWAAGLPLDMRLILQLKAILHNGEP